MNKVSVGIPAFAKAGIVTLLAAAAACGDTPIAPPPAQRDGGTDAGPGPTASLTLRALTPDGDVIPSATFSVGSVAGEASGETTRFDGLEPGRHLAIATANGYAPSTLGIDLPAVDGYADVVLHPLGDRVEFTPAQGLEYRRGEVKVVIPGGSVIDGAGAAVPAGAATFTLVHADARQAWTAPGPFIGGSVTAPLAVEAVALVHVGVWNGSVPAELSAGSTAALEVEIPADSSLHAGDLLAGWNLYHTTGVWKHEGNGQIVSRSGRLYWKFDAPRLGWWAAERRYTETTCAVVEVVEVGTGDPVPGVSVQVESEGDAFGSQGLAVTGTDGKGCVEVKRGGTFKVRAVADAVYSKSVPQATTLQAAAQCSAATSCQQVRIEVQPPACLSGTVRRGGQPLAAAQVLAKSGVSHRRFRASSGGDGGWCLEAPAGTESQLTAVALDADGRTWTATGHATVDTGTTCGAGSCTPAPALDVKLTPTMCVHGVIEADPAFGGVAARTGHSYHVFVATTFARIDCEKPPETWGTLVASGTVGAGGTYCMDLPDTVSEAYALVLDVCADRPAQCGAEVPALECSEPYVYYSPEELVGGGHCESQPSCLHEDLSFFQGE